MLNAGQGAYMTWYVKRRKQDGAVVEILCDNSAQVVENFYDQEQRGGEVWIEDEAGRKI
jgi:hypothetical protein